MRKRTSSIRRRALALAVAAVGVVAIAGTALAGHQTSGVKSYTGCLVGGDGVIIKVKEGNAPRSACTGGQVEAHFSGGDITKISVGNGLSTVPADGATGEVRIVLDASHSLPQSCTAGRVAEWNGSAWVCGVDDDTTYSAGTGLDLSSGDEFSIEPDYRLPGKACPTAGQFARGFDSDGEIQCAAPPAPSSGAEVWQKVNPAIGAGTAVVLPDGEGVDVITMPLPAGTFLVTAVASLEGRGTDEFAGSCELRDGAFNRLPVHPQGLDISDGALTNVEAVVTVHGVLSLGSAETVRFTCTSFDGDGDASGATMTAVKVGTLHTP